MVTTAAEVAIVTDKAQMPETPTPLSPLRQLGQRAGVLSTDPVSIALLKIQTLGHAGKTELTEALRCLTIGTLRPRNTQVEPQAEPEELTFDQFADKLAELEQMMMRAPISDLLQVNKLAHQLYIPVEAAEATLKKHFVQISQTDPKEAFDKLLKEYPDAQCYQAQEAHAMLEHGPLSPPLNSQLLNRIFTIECAALQKAVAHFQEVTSTIRTTMPSAADSSVDLHDEIQRGIGSDKSALRLRVAASIADLNKHKESMPPEDYLCYKIYLMEMKERVRGY